MTSTSALVKKQKENINNLWNSVKYQTLKLGLLKLKKRYNIVWTKISKRSMVKLNQDELGFTYEPPQTTTAICLDDYPMATSSKSKTYVSCAQCKYHFNRIANPTDRT